MLIFIANSMIDGTTLSLNSNSLLRKAIFYPHYPAALLSDIWSNIKQLRFNDEILRFIIPDFPNNRQMTLNLLRNTICLPQ